MADQTLAQSRPLSTPAAKNATPRRSLRERVPGACKVGRCWARYAFVGSHRGVPGLVDFVSGNHFFRVLQVPGELRALCDILEALHPECALEIGTAKGGTLFALTRLASSQATIVSVDLPGGRFGGGYGSKRRWLYQRFARSKQKLHLLQGDSHSPEMLSRVKAALDGEALDYLFIDGDHTYEGVRADFEMYGPMVRKGGVVAFHDIAEHHVRTGCEVSKLWNEVKSTYRYTELVLDKAQGWAGIGILHIDG